MRQTRSGQHVFPQPRSKAATGLMPRSGRAFQRGRRCSSASSSAASFGSAWTVPVAAPRHTLEAGVKREGFVPELRPQSLNLFRKRLQLIQFSGRIASHPLEPGVLTEQAPAPGRTLSQRGLQHRHVLGLSRLEPSLGSQQTPFTHHRVIGLSGTLGEEPARPQRVQAVQKTRPDRRIEAQDCGAGTIGIRTLRTDVVCALGVQGNSTVSLSHRVFTHGVIAGARRPETLWVTSWRVVVPR